MPVSLRSLITVLLGGAASGATLGAAPLEAQLPAARLDSIARRIVTSARYATFVTVDGSHQPQTRTVQPLLPDSTWTVWFATNPRTRKVGEVSRQPRVAMHYFDATTESYVALTGRARIVRDRREQDAHWNPAWDAFYKDRERGVVLIAVQVARVEVVSPKLGVDSDALTWRPQAFQPGGRSAATSPAAKR